MVSAVVSSMLSVLHGNLGLFDSNLKSNVKKILGVTLAITLGITLARFHELKCSMQGRKSSLLVLRQ